MTHARRTPSSSVGLPSGPTKSCSTSPGFICARRFVVAPTAWKTIVTVPASGSQSFMVSGMRSPRSSMRSMMNWPGLIFRAISGARTTMRVTSALSCSARSMGYTLPHPFSLIAHNKKQHLKNGAALGSKCRALYQPNLSRSVSNVFRTAKGCKPRQYGAKSHASGPAHVASGRTSSANGVRPQQTVPPNKHALVRHQHSKTNATASRPSAGPHKPWPIDPKR